ncbi:oligopeptide transporter [Tanacetum coccineum]
MEQYLALIQDNIRPGVVKPEISDDVKFEINSNFMRELRRKPFKGTDDEDVYEHVRRVLEIVDLFHFPSVTHDAVMLRVFPITLTGPALRWKNRLSAESITTWDLFEKAFIWRYCSPFKTAKKLKEIQDKAVEQSKYIESLEKTIIKYCEESTKKKTENDEWIRIFIKNTDLNLRAIDTTTENLHVKADIYSKLG